MSIQLSFNEELKYDDNPAGITIFVSLGYAGKNLRVEAKVDPGAEVCLFTHDVARRLGIAVESGIPIALSTLTDPLEAFGHEVTLQTCEMVFQSTVYFAKYPNLPRNILGRQGWLRKLKLAVIDYDNMLYLSEYDS